VAAFDEWLGAEATLAEVAASDPRVRGDVVDAHRAFPPDRRRSAALKGLRRKHVSARQCSP
jgi:hypothetical protein